jgi:hypothetical protein
VTPKSLGFQQVAIHFGTFDFTIFVIAGPFKNVEKYARWKMDDDTISVEGRPRGLCFLRPDYCPLVWIPRRPRTSREHGSFAHEMLHAIRNMLVDWAGLPLTRDTDEAFCHAMGHGVTKALEGLR